jgi:predicted secreted Zn-dependent protease
MRSTAAKALLAVLAASWFSLPALAGVKVVARTETYAIAGKTSAALVDAMDRKGPRHGFTTRAIAQTSYTVDWKIDVSQSAGDCRVVAATGTLHLTYTFPRVASAMDPGLGRRWKRFLAGVRKHEQTHGRIARAMVVAASKAAEDVALAFDPFCVRARGEAKRRIDAIYTAYEAKQIAFDDREHRPGGPVEHLVSALTSGR